MTVISTRLAAGTVTTVTLAAPDTGNALSGPMVEDLHDIVDTATRDGTRALLFEAEGRTFCGGLDLRGLDAETDASLLLRLVRIELLLEKLHWGPLLSIVVVEGAAAGAGADLVMAATVRYATPAASLRFPGSEFGAVLGSRRLADCTNAAFAAEAAATGRVIGAGGAAQAGIWTLFDEGAERPDAEALAAAVQHCSPETVTAIQRAAGSFAGAGADPMGDLVRSLAARPGLAARVRAMADRRRRARAPGVRTSGGST